ncbi:hypothetical protein N7520_005274 [Penicillium odoratum]|uniref:uncharacterized protein n=1 Tax=Penicillium odoratum TaxID=1167516 RepID=UPI002546B435|nr:uncharacterized protein N7520_005274 [Penicillium odoratum]KAJ5765715.1 hypothetical protein N7520_005274 [Penicillium odoratum]
MPAAVDASKKRKSSKNAGAPSKRRAVADDVADTPSTIEKLEKEIAESPSKLNNIVTLFKMLNVEESAKNPNLAVAVSLCRIFSRLMAAGDFTTSSRATPEEKKRTEWIRSTCLNYMDRLVDIMREADATSQTTALALSMRMIKARITHVPADEGVAWSNNFKSIVEAVIENQDLHTEFITKFLKGYEDVRYYTFGHIAEYAETRRSPEILDSIVSILSACDDVPSKDHKFENFFVTKNKQVASASEHKSRVQAAWVEILKNNLSQAQRKNLLRSMVHHIVPWFKNPHMLMDFLTRSYDTGGATSLLALSGLFYLIQETNLDYPDFYPKLYSLLDEDLLHSKHRSKFFRLLNTFLSSTHLPATLMASFIKKLARLALNAPPSAIVVIVPFMYNVFKSHPATTFMMHRVITDKKREAKIEEVGMDDPFNPTERDPTRTRAIESSLWEIVTLQSHYHPNVASIARIISEQFTKQNYNLEDFLDHTYQGMVTQELGTGERPLKKTPVVEYQIPKRIFTDRLLEEDGGVDSGAGSFMRGLWEFS